MSFFGSLFGGQSKVLDSNINKFGSMGDFASSMGEKDLTASSNFNNAILSGDSSKQASVLAPEIGAAKTSAQQEAKTRSQFGTRSGGTAASNVASGDKVHSDITSMIANLTGTAASTLGAQGSNLLQQGMDAFGKQIDASQQQMENWNNSILGKGMTTAAAAGETFALGG